jgi:phospholipase C
MRSSRGQLGLLHLARGATLTFLGLLAPLASLAVAPGCGSDGTADANGDAGSDAPPLNVEAGPGDDANPCAPGEATCNGTCIDVTHDDANCGACATTCTGGRHCAAAACTASKIEHVVLIVQENHTFDAYFGKYCTAPAGSNPTCTDGPSCCERAPDAEPRGAAPIVLDDTSNFAKDRDHTQACELQQINGGKMDGYVSNSTGSDTCLGSGPSCASAGNFALADTVTVGDYWTLAGQNALADRWFQPVAGGTSSNNMYFAVAHFQFLDNTFVPNAVGTPKGCIQGACGNSEFVTYQGRPTIADLLLDAGKTFTVYADGWAHAKSQAGSCESIPADCPYSSSSHPIAAQACKLDSSDLPFVYYERFAGGANITDYNELAGDIVAKKLPSFAYVKAREFHNEHPNVSTITDGIQFVKSTVGLIENSGYADSTLVLLTWDEGGGFFDHVAPPAGIDTDTAGNVVPYGTRVPLLAIGKFARKGAVSHVTMEHSSVVRFLEYNFLGPVGQLAANDAKVRNIGSLLDPAVTGIPIPE